MHSLSTRSVHLIIKSGCWLCAVLVLVVQYMDAMSFKEQFLLAASRSRVPAVPVAKESLKIPDLSMYLEIVRTDFLGTGDELFQDDIDLAALPQTDSSSGLKLMGTAVSKDTGSHVAFVYDTKEGKQLFLREGDEIHGIRIRRIYQSQIVINKDGKDEILALNKS